MESEPPGLDRWQKYQMKDKYYGLLTKLSKKKSPQALMRNRWVNMMIERIQSAQFIIAGDEGEKLHEVVKQALNEYEISYLQTQKQYILLKKSHIKSKPSAIVFPLEKSFEVTLEAHIFTNHGGFFAMEKWLCKSNYIVSAICLKVLISVCQSCTKGLEYQKESMHNYSSYSVVNVLDMSSQADNSFQFLLVYIDFNSNFVQLRPLTAGDLVSEISMELLRLISDFAVPPCIVVQKDWNEIFQMVLQRINMIVCEEIQLETDENDHQLTSEAAHKVNKWMLQNGDRWSMGCQFVQWEMNKLKKFDGSPYQKFFRLGPKYYKPNTSNTNKRDNLNSVVTFEEPRTFSHVITVSDDEIESEKSSNSSHSKKPVKSKTSSSVPNTAKRKVPDKSNSIESKKKKSDNLKNLFSEKGSSLNPSTAKVLDIFKSTKFNISEFSSQLNSLKSSSFPNTAKLKITDISKPINLKKSVDVPSSVQSNRSKFPDISKPSSSKVSDPNQEVIRNKNGSEIDERETHKCFTCEREMPAKEAYFCCVCNNSLHLYCGARRQGDSNVECICFMCMNL